MLRIAPLPGNPVLNERTIPAPAVLAHRAGVSLLLGALLWLLAQVSTFYQRVGTMARTTGSPGWQPTSGSGPWPGRRAHRGGNRRAWDGELARELDRAARSKLPLSVALIDLDRFKAYNDQHGHQAGDRLLSAAWMPAR